MITFKDLDLNPMILEALTELKFETPTAIQAKIIPHLIKSENDLIALAQTGTGKTAAFALPIIQQLDDRNKSVQSLILCPTRELAIQVASDIQKYLKYSPGFLVAAVYGGERIDKQIRTLRRKPQIVVGTPGRVNDMIKRSLLKVDSIKWLVLDEADEMLNMGFKEELDEILKNTPESKQVLLFSATMNRQVRRIASNYMKNIEDITVGDKNKGTDNVQHFYYIVHEKDRYQTLRRIADANPDIHGIVFCRTRQETQQIADKLIKDNYSAEAIHGEISQEQRTHVMNRFREKKCQLLVATDVAARGIDVIGLTHVINYNLPDSAEAYLHRSGRTGRANNMGISLVIVNMREKYKIKTLERRIGKSFGKEPIPSGQDICEKQLFKLIDTVRNIEVDEAQIGKYLNLISKKFENMDRDELIKKFVSVEFNRFLEHYKDAIDLNSRVGTERDQRSGRSSILFALFKVNVGRNLGLDMKEFLLFLNQQPELKGVEFGNIDIRKDHTLFEIDEKIKDKVMSCFENAEVNGIIVKVTCEKTGVISTRIKRPRRGGPKRRGPERGGPKRRPHKNIGRSRGGRKRF